MNTCARCGSTHMGKGKICVACQGRPHSTLEFKAVSAGPTMQTPEEKSPPMPRQPGAGEPVAPRPTPKPVAAVVKVTGEMHLRNTPTTGSGADDTQEIDPLIGREPLGQYRILAKIGEGGFGSVYIADQLGVGRKAVIKVLRANLAGSEAFVKRFQREASVLAALDHHNLVRLFNFGRLPDGQLFLAMEYGGDRTLADEIKANGRLAIERSLRIAEQVCLALHEAHARGVIHRDLKPANIMLGQKEGHDWVKVVDVGIAKILDAAEVDDGQARLTADGTIIGTPAYFSPEQARGLPLDGRSDVYSMGCVLYETISGQLPINARTPVDFVRAHCMDAPVPLSERGIVMPPSLQALIARALAKSPQERPTAKELAARLAEERALLGRKPGKSRQVIAAVAAGCIAILSVSAAVLWPRKPKKPVPSLPPAVAITAETAAPVPAEPPRAPPQPAIAPPAASATSPAAVPVNAEEIKPPETKPAETVSRPRHSRADPWAARIARVAALSTSRKYAEAVLEGERALRQNPPPAAKGSLFKLMGNASYDNGDGEAALRYFESYRQYCPPGDLPALNKMLDRLRADLGLAPSR